MFNIFIEVIGGVGLFLLGMGLLTEGLKAMAGDAIRTTLTRFTRSPVSGVVTGTVSAAILQSSSATIIATVGFVGGGLLSFSQALGVVLGASIGTTFTGWWVAFVGFKLKLGAVASLLILVGALLRLFGGPRRSGLAYSLAGFGLIFTGVVAMQEGMGALQYALDFDQFAGQGWGARVQLVLMGVAFTLVTQSSNAGVVAALTALHTGVIGFDQAACLVIGMNTGTTFTSAVATIGGNANVRRTGFSHVVYNAVASLGALFLMKPYVAAWDWLLPGKLAHFQELALVGFHTLFNLIGVMVMLPFINRYARFMELLFPEPPREDERTLDRSLLKYPELALGAVQKVLAEQVQKLAQQVLYILGELPRPVPLTPIAEQLEKVQAYVDAIHLDANDSRDWQRLLATIHLLDYLQRLSDRCQNKSLMMVLHDAQELHVARQLLKKIATPFANEQPVDAETLQAVKEELHAHEKALRDSLTRQIAEGRIDMKQGVSLTEAVRWLQRVSVHLTRIDKFSRQLSYRKANTLPSAAKTRSSEPVPKVEPDTVG